jgi:hypothetical protein
MPAARTTFRARLHRLGPLYAVKVPTTVVKALGDAKQIPVIAHYLGDAHPSTVTPARGGGGRLFLRVEVFRPQGLEVGDEVEVSLAPDHSKRVTVTPPDLQRALQFRPTALAGWDRAAPSTRRIVVENLNEARSPETRLRRIEKLVEAFAEREAARGRKK